MWASALRTAGTILLNLHLWPSGSLYIRASQCFWHCHPRTKILSGSWSHARNDSSSTEIKCTAGQSVTQCSQGWLSWHRGFWGGEGSVRHIDTVPASTLYSEWCPELGTTSAIMQRSQWEHGGDKHHPSSARVMWVVCTPLLTLLLFFGI